VLDKSEGICERRRENVSNEHRAAACHVFFVLNSVTMSPQHMQNFSRPMEMMQCKEPKPFAGTKCFLKTETLLKIAAHQTTISNTDR
jgi:hypothetical protein